MRGPTNVRDEITIQQPMGDTCAVWAFKSVIHLHVLGKLGSVLQRDETLLYHN